MNKKIYKSMQGYLIKNMRCYCMQVLRQRAIF